MSRIIYSTEPVLKRRWWSVSTPSIDANPELVLAETKSKARYSYWLDIRDYCSYKITDISVHATKLDPVYERRVLHRPAPAMKPRRTMTHAEWIAEAERRFGKKAMDWRFACPSCGEDQSMKEFVDAGMTVEEAQSRGYFSCIGRWVKGRGCDWTLGGLFQIHSLDVLDEEGKKHPVFEFAEPAQVGVPA